MAILFQNYSKSIRLCTDGFVFSKFEKNRWIELFHSKNDFLPLFEKTKQFFGKNCNDITLIASKNPPILIPKSLYDSDLKEQYIKLNCKIPEDSAIFEDEIDNYISIYYIDSQLIKPFAALNYHCIHLSTLLYRYVHQPEIEMNAPHLFALYNNDNKVDFIFKKNHNLEIINSFHYSSEYDIYYLFLNIAKQHQISINDIQVLIFNDPHKSIEKLMKNLVPNITFIL
ncbi:MAG: DUF3822 family protein [Bacteroidales bacterium]|jgi:hypothetical protein|nr:DUF3822 family protein [Bacteroidales bacterium]